MQYPDKPVFVGPGRRLADGTSSRTASSSFESNETSKSMAAPFSKADSPTDGNVPPQNLYQSCYAAGHARLGDTYGGLTVNFEQYRDTPQDLPPNVVELLKSMPSAVDANAPGRHRIPRAAVPTPSGATPPSSYSQSTTRPRQVPQPVVPMASSDLNLTPPGAKPRMMPQTKMVPGNITPPNMSPPSNVSGGGGYLTTMFKQLANVKKEDYTIDELKALQATYNSELLQEAQSQVRKIHDWKDLVSRLERVEGNRETSRTNQWYLECHRCVAGVYHLTGRAYLAKGFSEDETWAENWATALEKLELASDKMERAVQYLDDPEGKDRAEPLRVFILIHRAMVGVAELWKLKEGDAQAVLEARNRCPIVAESVKTTQIRIQELLELYPKLGPHPIFEQFTMVKEGYEGVRDFLWRGCE
ncbi:hypothetical protein H072_9852 [Dactylellina haptotyla CBS 200.50]|uniref:Uncharacterized protein n=1 Tax=Dactylellina haptotyla (strain CBS 200.50) TaxID=1284197 RepID=S8A647_DACHA|nr:hypothetical protein H072_9852 [Dactylellina haptotyla CBS 200.50]